MKTKICQLPPAKVSEKLKTETIKCAEIEQENLSEYIRKAVEMRNMTISPNRKLFVPAITSEEAERIRKEGLNPGDLIITNKQE